MRTITVLVIACPHALGLAIPLVVSIATERAARGGVLIKDRLALESMRTVGAVLFDKTGTLTKGEPTVTAIATTGGRAEDEVLALAAAAESDSEHPLARAIVEAARRRGLTVPASSDFSSSPAVGVTAAVDGRRVRVGGPRLLEEAGQAELPDVGAVARRGRDHPARACRRRRCVVARWRWPTRCARSRARPSTRCTTGHPGRDDHRRRRIGGRVGGRRARHRPGIRRGAARRQGRQGRRALQAEGLQGRDGG